MSLDQQEDGSQIIFSPNECARPSSDPSIQLIILSTLLPKIVSYFRGNPDPASVNFLQPVQQLVSKHIRLTNQLTPGILSNQSAKISTEYSYPKTDQILLLHFLITTFIFCGESYF